MSDPRKTVVILGAGGKTGLELVAQAKARGHRVHAVEHNTPFEAADGENVLHFEHDVMTDDLSDAMDGADAVLSGLGIAAGPDTVFNPPPLYTEGTRRTVEAMEKAGVKRLIVVSASFTQTLARGPIWFRGAAAVGLKSIFEQMKQMEWYLRGKDSLDWTAVRPGWLLEEPLTEDYTVSEDVIPDNLIRTRHADLAHFMLTCLEDGAWIKGTPAIARAEPASVSSPLAVIKEMMG